MKEPLISTFLAKALTFLDSKQSLENTVVIPQLYPHMPRKDDGTTDTWVWYEEFFVDRSGRVNGGGSHWGGLADVCLDYSGGRWRSISLRPLAVL